MWDSRRRASDFRPVACSPKPTYRNNSVKSSISPNDVTLSLSTSNVDNPGATPKSVALRLPRITLSLTYSFGTLAHFAQVPPQWRVGVNMRSGLTARRGTANVNLVVLSSFAAKRTNPAPTPTSIGRYNCHEAPKS